MSSVKHSGHGTKKRTNHRDHSAVWPQRSRVRAGASEGALAAGRPAAGSLPEKADARVAPEALAALARIQAREAALAVADTGLRWVAGADGVATDALGSFERDLGLPAIHRAQAGALADMDLAADAIYGR